MFFARKDRAAARQAAPRATFPARRSFHPVLEQLEDRVVVSSATPPIAVPTSAAPAAVAPPIAVPPHATPTHIIYKPQNRPFQSSTPVGFAPQQIQTAYGFNIVYGTIGNGAGQTIAIVDAFDDPAFVNSTDPTFVNSDLHKFDVQFGLPDPPSFTKLNQTGGTALPPVNPIGPPADSWAVEEALDVEWAHSIAPGANIILFEANSSAFTDLFTAVATAAHTPGVSVVSMSFGSTEFTGEQTFDSTFTTPAGHQGVTFAAATGDSGAPGSYPAYSPNVLAVGGTSLFLNPNNTYNSESGWSGSGGGISQFEPQPAYQKGVVTQSTAQRTIPDVAFEADPNTGVAVYDSFNNGTATPWVQVGGTSLACPSWAALISIADEGLAHTGRSTLDGPSQTIPDLYRLYKTNPLDFHDITTGNNGFPAGPGYDLVTGMGSPVANLVIQGLVGATVQVSNGIEGTTATLQATIGGTGPVSALVATISFGDGTSAMFSGASGQIIDNGNGTFTIIATHLYREEGTYTVGVTLTNVATGATSSFTQPIIIADAPLFGSGTTAKGLVGEQALNVEVATFTDTNPFGTLTDFSAQVTWDDGNGRSHTSAGRIVPLGGTSFAVFADDTISFSTPGPHGVSVLIRDVGGSQLLVQSTLNVASNPAFNTFVPIYAGDAIPAGLNFTDLENALTNVLSAEQRLFGDLLLGHAAGTGADFRNFFSALSSYFTVLAIYDRAFMF